MTEITEAMEHLQMCRVQVKLAREKREAADRAVTQAYQAEMEAEKQLRALVGLPEPQRDPHYG